MFVLLFKSNNQLSLTSYAVVNHCEEVHIYMFPVHTICAKPQQDVWLKSPTVQKSSSKHEIMQEISEIHILLN